MLARERHRGPDDEGIAVLTGSACEELGALGNVRLAILDPSPAGHQPMQRGGLTLVLNGELYNHLEVRRAMADGVSWSSGADTETLLRAHARWGRDCLARFRGMFAFGVWDAGARELFCVRDRLGIKPFYYAVTPEAFVFASEVRALLASGLLGLGLDLDGLASYVRFGSLSEPRTLVEGVRSMRAGSWLRVSGGAIREEGTYWRPEAGEVRHSASQVQEELERAVGEHLLSDVPIASLLSSGLDSSLVTALASRHTAGRLRTFTLAWSDPELDESRAAETLARSLGTEHTTVRYTDREMVELVERALQAMDLPTQDGLNTYLVSHAVATSGIKVVLSGLGGDELFGGYPSFRLVPVAHRLAPALSLVPGLVRALAGGGGRGERAGELVARGGTLAERYEAVRALWSRRQLEELGVPLGSDALASWPAEQARGGVAVSLLELSGYMRNTLLRDTDVMSMAHSLELRVPLLDHRLVEACLTSRAAEGWGGRGSKAALRTLASRVLPAEALSRSKRGFALPMDRWLRGPLRDLACAGIEVLRAARVPLKIHGLEARFDSGEVPWARWWQFVVLGHWFARNPGVA